MSASKILTAAVTTAALAASGGVATAADAPVVTKQQWVAGYALADFPGTGLDQGEWAGSKAKMLFRRITLEQGQSVRTTFRAPEGLRIRALGHVDGSQLSVVANGDYAGDRSVTVRVSIPGHVDAEEVSERLYVLAK